MPYDRFDGTYISLHGHAVRFIVWSPISSMTPPPPPPTVFFGIQPNTCDSMLNNLNNIQLFRAAHLLRIAPWIVEMT